MKIQILIALGGVAALAGAAHAQDVQDKSNAPQLGNIPDLGEFFRAPITRVNPYVNPLFGPEMPPRPQLERSNVARTKLSVLPSPRGEVFQLEAVNQNRAAILKKITDVMGVRAIIDPQLAKKIEITQVFRGLSWDELLASVNYGVEMVKSPAGTYFFADAPIALLTLKVPSNYDSRNPDSPSPEEQLRSGPFVYEINPSYQPPQPQPDWQKREFNGREFYRIPVPKP